MRCPSSVTTLLIAVASLVACADREVARHDPVAEHVLRKYGPVSLNRDLDILFVVDDSGSMAGEQAALAANFPAFMAVLQTVEGGLPDVHIGIVSTDVGAAGMAAVPGCAGQGDDGDLRVAAGCTGLDGRFIADGVDAQGHRVRNYTGDLDTLFACMAQLGTDGCGFEMPLESAYRALQPGKNPGFLRPDAYLAVVFISDEDDCSTERGTLFADPNAGLGSPLGPRTSFRCFEFGVTCADGPADPRAFGTRTGCRAQPSSPYLFAIDKYVAFLKSLKPDPSMVMVAGVLGVDDDQHTVVVGPDPANPTHPAVGKSCFLVDPGAPTDGAAPPIRLAEFLRGFPNRNTLTSICSPSFVDALRDVAEGIHGVFWFPCLQQPLRDRNPALPGPQYECSVTDVRTWGGVESEHVIPACGGAEVTTPCWRVTADPVECRDQPGQLRLDVDRGGALPPSGTWLRVECVVD